MEAHGQPRDGMQLRRPLMSLQIGFTRELLIASVYFARPYSGDDLSFLRSLLLALFLEQVMGLENGGTTARLSCG